MKLAKACLRKALPSIGFRWIGFPTRDIPLFPVKADINILKRHLIIFKKLYNTLLKKWL